MPRTEDEETHYLFVYGTLMKAAGHPMARRLQRESVSVGGGQVGGRLYSLGPYPGVVLSDAPWDCVHGEVVRLTDPARSFVWIDEYEGCGRRNPEPHDYERVIVPAHLYSGETLNSWIYVYKGPLTHARRIPSGRFFAARRLAETKTS